MANENDTLYGAYVGTKFGLTWDFPTALAATEKLMAETGLQGEIRAMVGPLDDYPSFDYPTFRILSNRVWPTPQNATEIMPKAVC